jgi:hypothetical protein
MDPVDQQKVGPAQRPGRVCPWVMGEIPPAMQTPGDNAN